MSKPVLRVWQDSSSCWPICFSVKIDSLTLHFNMSIDDTDRFIKLLTYNNNRGEYMKFITRQGAEFEARWLTDDTIQLVYKIWQSNKIIGTPFILKSEDAKLLAELTLSIIKNDFYDEKKSVDLLAGARRRTNENLYNVFG